jgi:hypothetical protein
MEFKNWLNTIDYNPNDQPNTNKLARTQGFHQILTALKKIDPSIPDPNGEWQPTTRNPNGSQNIHSYSGTPDYGAPEQWKTTTRHAHHSQDNYEIILTTVIPKIFPNHAQEAHDLAQAWTQFRNKIVHHTTQEHTNTPLRPAHYALSLTQLHDTQNILKEIGQIIKTNLHLKILTPEYNQLYHKHKELFQKIKPTLTHLLHTARTHPNYGL